MQVDCFPSEFAWRLDDKGVAHFVDEDGNHPSYRQQHNQAYPSQPATAVSTPSRMASPSRKSAAGSITVQIDVDLHIDWARLRRDVLAKVDELQKELS